MRVAIYARVSTDSDDQTHALHQQLERLRHAAGVDDEISEFIDVASGSRDDRRQLQRLLKACRSGQIDKVLCTRLDRMSRSMAHGAELLTYFSADDTPSLVALDDALDLGTVGGRLVARMLINLAQAETERLSERVLHGNASTRKAGRPFGPHAPYGYRWNADRTNYELDPETAPAARQLVQHFIATGEVRGTLRLAQTLPHCKFKSTTGLHMWLMNPTLMGCRCYGRTVVVRQADGTLKRKQRAIGDFETVIPHAHEPLISADDHQKVCSQFNSHRNRSRAKLQSRFAQELTGLVICGHCGRRMSYHYAKGVVHQSMRCIHPLCPAERTNRIRCDLVQKAILNALYANRDGLLVVEMASELLCNQPQPKAEKLQAEIRWLESREDPDLAEAIAHKQQRLAALWQDVLTTSEMQAKAIQSQQAMETDRFWEALQDTPERRRQLFTDYVERVVVTDRAISAVELRRGIPQVHHMG